MLSDPKKTKREVICLSSLTGSFTQSMDIKGRMSFPIKLREILGEQIVVTRGLDGCLFAYASTAFEEMAARIEALPMSKGRELQRFFLSWASEVTADKQGRILIPQNLREFAGLDKEIIVTGVGNRAEIWDKATWEALNDRIDEDRIMDQMEELNF